MEYDIDTPETEEEYQERRSELIESAKESKQDLDADQNEMLAAVASGEDGLGVEKYETVQIGEVEATVKAWLPGDTQDTIQHAHRLAQRENMEDAQESIYTMIEGMTTVTERLDHIESETVFEEKEKIRNFWNGMYGQWGVQGFQQAASIVLEPANDEMEDMSNAVDGFRKDGPRPEPSVSGGNDGE